MSRFGKSGGLDLDHERLASSASGAGPKLVHRAYTGLWGVLVRWFRVPQDPPTLPTAPGEEALSFRPSEAYLRYLKLLFWIACLAIDVVLTLLWIAATIALFASGLWYVAIPLAPFMIALIVLPDVIAYVAIHLRYDTTWYVLTSRSLRVRHGIWIIRELTLTFENVQNVRLTSGPIQRHFGIASVAVDTAGGGAGGPKGHGGGLGHQASIDGITNAEEVRDLIMSRVRASRAAGLGDEHDRERAAWAASRSHAGASSGGAAFTPAHLELLRGIRDELRAAATAAAAAGGPGAAA